MNTAYSTPIEFNLRIQKTMFPFVVTLTLIANAYFAVCGLSKAEGIYGLLVYLLLVQLLFEVVDRNSNQLPEFDNEDEPELQLPFFDNVLPYVAVWLLWWLATSLLFHAKIVSKHGLPGQLALLLLVLIFALLRFVLRLKPTAFWIIVIRFLLRVISCTLIFFPTRDWAPQHASWMGTVARVTLFFLASFAFNAIVPNYRDRVNDNLVLVWWILITPFYISLFALPLLIGLVFFTQTKLRLVFESQNAADIENGSNSVDDVPAKSAAQLPPPSAQKPRPLPIVSRAAVVAAAPERRSVTHSATTTLSAAQPTPRVVTAAAPAASAAAAASTAQRTPRQNHSVVSPESGVGSKTRNDTATATSTEPRQASAIAESVTSKQSTKQAMKANIELV